jgi:hypothetical protein
MYSSTTLSADFPVRLVVLEQQLTADLMASLYYTAADPHAVRLAFHPGVDAPVEWVVARDLLTGGLDAYAGVGDVRVWPAEDGEPVLYIALTSPSGDALFEAPRDKIADFLRSTARIVPLGAEGAFVSIDAELADLLDCA